MCIPYFGGSSTVALGESNSHVQKAKASTGLFISKDLLKIH